jgi:hypothetical protein
MRGELRDHPHIRQLRESRAAYGPGTEDRATLQAYMAPTYVAATRELHEELRALAARTVEALQAG